MILLIKYEMGVDDTFILKSKSKYNTYIDLEEEFDGDQIYDLKENNYYWEGNGQEIIFLADLDKYSFISNDVATPRS